MPLTKIQKFKIETVARKAIHGAPYNPRQIDEHAKTKLRNNLKKIGLLSPIVVNRRTGNVVSGHQRLDAMDALEGSGSYELQVAYVELTEKQEKEQNIFMNNESAMGTFKVDALDALVKEIDITNAGFDMADLQMILPDYELPESEAEKEHVADVQKQQAQLQKIKEQRKKQNENYKSSFAASSAMVQIVFDSPEEVDSFLDAIKLPRTELYISSQKFFAAIEAHFSGIKSKFAVAPNKSRKPLGKTKAPVK